MWQVIHISGKTQRTEEKLITLFIEQMHCDTMKLKIKNTTLIIHHLIFVDTTLLLSSY